MTQPKGEMSMFSIGDTVTLISDSFEDSGHFADDTGTVIDQKVNDHGGWTDQDIRVEWDNGAETCWISAEDCI